MKIYSEISLRNFDFWSGAKDTADMLSYSDFDAVEEILEDLYPEGMDETEVNDLFWFEEDTIAEWLGFSSWAEFIGDVDEEDDEEDEEDEEEED